MKTGSEALILLYSLFWAAALAMTGRYQAFDAPSMWAREPRAVRRFVVGLLVLNLFPILWLTLLYRLVVPAQEGWAPIAAAAVAALSVFGFHRILHALIASDATHSRFYTADEIRAVRNRDPFTQPQTFAAHFWPGLIYIVACGGAAWLVGRASL